MRRGYAPGCSHWRAASGRALLSNVLPLWIIRADASALIAFSIFCFGTAIWRHLNPGPPPPKPNVRQIPHSVLVSAAGVVGGAGRHLGGRALSTARRQSPCKAALTLRDSSSAKRTGREPQQCALLIIGALAIAVLVMATNSIRIATSRRACISMSGQAVCRSKASNDQRRADDATVRRQRSIVVIATPVAATKEDPAAVVLFIGIAAIIVLLPSVFGGIGVSRHMTAAHIA